MFFSLTEQKLWEEKKKKKNCSTAWQGRSAEKEKKEEKKQTKKKKKNHNCSTAWRDRSAEKEKKNHNCPTVCQGRRAEKPWEVSRTKTGRIITGFCACSKIAIFFFFYFLLRTVFNWLVRRTATAVCPLTMSSEDETTLLKSYDHARKGWNCIPS